VEELKSHLNEEKEEKPLLGYQPEDYIDGGEQPAGCSRRANLG